MTHQIAFPSPSTVPELALAKEVRAMFLGNEQGAWYDPSDRATLFQDAAGTTPVTAVEQPVGLVLDKSKGLVFGPELVANGIALTDSDANNIADGFSIAGAPTPSIVTGNGFSGRAQRIVNNSSNTYQGLTFSGLSSIGGGAVGKWYLVSFEYRANAGIANVRNEFPISFPANTGSAVKVTVLWRPTIAFDSTTLRFLAWGGGYAENWLEVGNISVRELPGNHAFQTTAASRPVLSARVNRLLKTESPTEWSYASTVFTVVNSSGGAFEVSALEVSWGVNAYIGPHDYYPVGSSLSGSVTLVKSIEVKKGTARYLRFGAATDGSAVFFDFDTGVIVRNAGVPNMSAVVNALDDGWFRIECWESRSTWDASQLSFGIGWSPSWPGSSELGPTGQIGSTVWFRNVSFVVESFNYTRPIRYQRVNTATDYDTAGFPHYLRFDGVDDGLQTNAINFTSTDKMTVFAGVRKLSDAAPGMLVELSTNINAEPGAFYVAAPELTGVNGDYRFRSRGELIANTAPSTGSASAPTTDVVVGIGDISGDYKAIRRNGVLGGSSPEDQGSGNYGNYPLFIGRRAGTFLPFNGHLYQLIVRGAQSTPSQIQAGERWTNNRTGAY
jgi:hypothetical protein